MSVDLGLIGEGRIRPPTNILLSYHYYRRVDLDRYSSCRIVADSGAFSAKTLGKEISTKQLVAWTRKWEHRLAWAACLDVPSVKQTKRNWERMVYDHGIPAVSTLHAGDPPETMDWYAEQGVDFLGLGGMAGEAWSAAAVFRWLVSIFKYAQDNHPQMRFHGWGMTHRNLLRLPFFSVDSSGWGSSYRYGRIVLRDPVTGKNIGVELNGRAVFKPGLAQMMMASYGVTPSEIAKAGPHNRDLLVRLSALSAAVQEQQWRNQFRRRPISAPKWGHLGGWWADSESSGPHIHLVDGHPAHMQVVADLAKEALSWA